MLGETLSLMRIWNQDNIILVPLFSRQMERSCKQSLKREGGEEDNMDKKQKESNKFLTRWKISQFNLTIACVQKP